MKTKEMTVLHINAGNEYGGGLFHILSLFQGMREMDMELLVLEEGPVAKQAREKGISVTVLLQRSRYDLSILKKLKTFINQRQFDIVHTHGPRANLLVGLIRKTLKPKWVTTIHSDPTLDFKGRGWKGKAFEWLNLKSLKRPDHLIAVSTGIKARLVDHQLKEQQITVVHNGRAFLNSANKEMTDTEKDIFKMVSIGRLEWVKGHRFLIEALSNLTFDQWKLRICGIGGEEPALRALVESLGLESNVTFLGWVESAAVSEQLLWSDMLINPSLSESFPLVALEAGEKKRPIIATNVGDVEQMLPTSDLGWLIPEANSEALSSAIEEAYQEWSQEKLSVKGERFYNWTKQFTIEKQGMETLAVYKKCLAD